MTFGVDKITTLNNPDNLKAANTILNGIEANNLITIHTLCTTDYSGRAEGGIDEGERVVMIKPKSGTFLVHGEEGYKPINWQPSDAEFSVTLTNDDDNLNITAETKENLTVTCKTIYQLTVFNNTDNATLELVGTEEEMHNRIMNDPTLVEKGLSKLQHEKEFDFGRVDVFAYDETDTPVIIEVKRRPATRDHIYQLYTYIMDYENEFGENVRGILVAPSCTDYILEILHDYDLEFSKLEPV